jgi:tight adherence protein B
MLLVDLLLVAAVLLWPVTRRAPLDALIRPRTRWGGPRSGLGPPPAAPSVVPAAAGAVSSASPLATPGPATATVVGRRLRAALRGAGRVEADEDLVLHLSEALVPALRAGLSSGRALRLAAEAVIGDGVGTAEARDRLAGLQTAAAGGEPLGPRWVEWAEASGSAPVALLGRAWSLSEQTGAALADGVATAGDAVRESRDTRRCVESATAGARATMNLLTLLPAGGLAVAALVGLGPAELYRSAAAQAALATGLVLLLLGRWWVVRQTRAATRGRPVR